MAIAPPESEEAPVPVPYRDLEHTGPGTLAGRYLRMFWQPIYVASSLEPGRAVPIRIMSEDFTLYRGEAASFPLPEGEGTKPHLLAFRCAHRGTQLSTGWVEGDNIRCFYHGWKYDCDGRCIEQPAEPEPFCNRINIRGYPVQEYLGLIFAYVGDGTPPPFPRYPWFEEDDGRSMFEVYGDQMAPFNWWNKIDNDAPHLPFVHRVPGTPFGDMISIRSEETEYGTCDYTVQGGVPNMTHHVMPNARIFVSFRPPGGWQERLNFDALPVDDDHAIAFGVGKNHFYTRDALDQYVARPKPGPPSPDEGSPVDVAARILRGEMTIDEVRHRQLVYIQDLTSQWGQGTTLNRAAEHLGRSDVGVIAWRTIWERELRALAEGRPLKEWRIPERLELNHSFMADYPTLKS